MPLLSDPLFVQALIAGGCVGGAFIVIMYIMTVVCIFCRFKSTCRTKQNSDVEKPPSTQAAVMTSYRLSTEVVPERTIRFDAMNGDNAHNTNTRFNLKKMIGQALAKKVKGMLIDNDRLALDACIGEGNFGVVYKGYLTDPSYQTTQPVAVKIITSDEITGEDLSAFIEEILRMQHFNHKNVLSMLGIVIENQMPKIIMPYMENGDLKSYVSDPSNEFDAREMASFGLQVAEGMIYLGTHGFVHRDLAARNCMVSERKVVKVADFGLSRDIFNDGYYKVETMTALPIRWMAVESITSEKFSVKSDVWSFGILLWELFTRGSMPYPGMEQHAVITFIKRGERMKAPPHTPDDIYVLMMECWHEISDKRPTFRDIHESLGRLISGSSMDTDAHANYQNTAFK